LYLCTRFRLERKEPENPESPDRYANPEPCGEGLEAKGEGLEAKGEGLEAKEERTEDRREEETREGERTRGEGREAGLAVLAARAGPAGNGSGRTRGRVERRAE